MNQKERITYVSIVLDGFKFLLRSKEVQMPKVGWTNTQTEKLADLQFHIVLLKECFKRWEVNGVNLYAYLGDKLYEQLVELCAEVLNVDREYLRVEYKGAKIYKAMPEHSADLVSVCGA